VTRAERFGDLVIEAVDRLQPRWRETLESVEVEVRTAPDPRRSRSDEVVLAEHQGARSGRTATLVVYRHPVEIRAPDHISLVSLIRDLVAEQLAEVLGTTPSDIDPSYDERSNGD